MQRHAVDRQQTHPLLQRLRAALARKGSGQERLDRVTKIIADTLGIEVCSIYLLRDTDTLELCSTCGLNAEAVHKTRLKIGEGLVGKVARTAQLLNTGKAHDEPGFRYMPETGEERYMSFLGVPILGLGTVEGVLVVQSREDKVHSGDVVFLLGIVAVVLAEMAESGSFVGKEAAMAPLHTRPYRIKCTGGQEGLARGFVLLHEPRVIVSRSIADNPDLELAQLHDAIEKLRKDIDRLIAVAQTQGDMEQRAVFEAYRMLSRSNTWVRLMEVSIQSGLTAAAAADKAQVEFRSQMLRSSDAYMRERLHDLDDLSLRLLRLLTGQTGKNPDQIPKDPILVARNIGTGELLEYGRSLKGVVLEEGSLGSHATIIARSLAVPLVINATGITSEALNGDLIFVNGETGVIHLRPGKTLLKALGESVATKLEAQRLYAGQRHLPAKTKDGVVISLLMNAGLLPDLPSLEVSGADGVGLFRTELQFLAVSELPRRSHLAEHYASVMTAARGKKLAFRTLDVGSDKILPYLRRTDEPNPALGWRAIRLALDKRGIMRMQLQALIRGAQGRPISIMFPLVADLSEFRAAKTILNEVVELERSMNHIIPASVEVGAMLETPSIAFESDKFFEEVDFISIGGNDLKQFFFAADRQNEHVRRRYDTLNVSYLSFIEKIVNRCARSSTPLSYCGEDAGRPAEAVCLAAVGLRSLSMRPIVIGRIRHYLRHVDLSRVRKIITDAENNGEHSVRAPVEKLLSDEVRDPQGLKINLDDIVTGSSTG